MDCIDFEEYYCIVHKHELHMYRNKCLVPSVAYLRRRKRLEVAQDGQWTYSRQKFSKGKYPAIFFFLINARMLWYVSKNLDLQALHYREP